MSYKDFPKTDLGFTVKQDASSTQNKEIESLDLRRNLLSGQLSHGHGSFYVVPAKGVRRNPGEDRDLYRERLAQL